MRLKQNNQVGVKWEKICFDMQSIYIQIINAINFIAASPILCFDLHHGGRAW